jgi:hypothetical protein
MKSHRKIICLLLLLLAMAGTCPAKEAHPGETTKKSDRPATNADQLADIYQAIRNGRLPLLQGQPIYVHSETGKTLLKADVYSIVHYSVADLSRALTSPRNWCQFVTLHLNIKACTYRLHPEPMLSIYAGRKFYEPPEKATRMDYRFQVMEQSNRRLALLLTAEKGQLSTRDYRFEIEAETMNPHDVLLHFSLSYRGSLASRMATRAYLSTLGRDKLGFSKQPDSTGKDGYVKGVRGIVERNAMRYFLALTVYLNTLDEKGPRTEAVRSRAWFDLTQRYAPQLREVDRTDYLIAKKQEFENQKNLQSQIEGGASGGTQPADQ